MVGGAVITGAGIVGGGTVGGDKAMVDGTTVAASAVDETTPPHADATTGNAATDVRSAIIFRRLMAPALTSTVRRKIVPTTSRNGDTRRQSYCCGISNQIVSEYFVPLCNGSD